MQDISCTESTSDKYISNVYKFTKSLSVVGSGKQLVETFAMDIFFQGHL